MRKFCKAVILVASIWLSSQHTLCLLQFVSCCYVKDHEQKQLGVGKGLFGLSFHVTSIIEEGSEVKNLSRNLEAGTELEAMQESCLLACLPWYYISELGPPMSFINQ